MAHYSKVANGNIKPYRFVRLDTTATGRVVQAGAGEKIWGVSQKGTRLPPLSDGIISLDDGYAAIAGESLNIFGPGEGGMEVLVMCGTVAVTAGDRLKSGTDGEAITTVTDTQEVGAIALRSAVSGELVPVQLIFPAQVSA